MRGQWFIFPAVLCSFLVAQDPKSAEAFVKEGVAYSKANGKTAFFNEVTSATGHFNIKVKKSLFLRVYDEAGMTLAHGQKAEKVGTSHINAKDSNGKMYMKDCIALANAKGSGWVDYVELNKETKVQENKATFVEKFDGMYICSSIVKR